MVEFVSPNTDPFFTDLSGLTLQSGVGVGPGGRLVKDEYTVGGGGGGGGGGSAASSGVASATSSGVVSSGMDVDGEINQTIQHHPPPQQSSANNSQTTQQQFIPGLTSPNPGKLKVVNLLLPFFISIPITCRMHQKIRIKQNFDGILVN